MENSLQKMEKGLLRRVLGVQGFGGVLCKVVSPISVAQT
jgi:hypothetical protein